HPDGMHGHAPGCFVDRRHQSGDVHIAARSEHMHHPCAVFAARPGDKDLHLNASGWRVSASRRTAPTPRGPGTTNSPPTSRYTRLVFTAGTAGSAFQTRRSAATRSGPRGSPYRSSMITSGARARTVSALMRTDSRLMS